MGKFSFGGCMQGLARANSKNLAGFVEGSVTHLKKGERQVLVENGKVICFIVGEDDIVIDKAQIKSMECVSQGITRQYGNTNYTCDVFAVTLQNGEFGKFTIFKGKVADFTIALKI